MKKIILILVLLGLLACVFAYMMHAPSKAVYKVTDLGILGGENSHAVDINNNCQIVGYYYFQRDNYIYKHAFIWEKGVIKYLGTMGFKNNTPIAINDKGQVIGRLQDKGKKHRADESWYIWQNGKMTELNALNALHAYPKSFNNAGQIVGIIWDDKEEYQGFFWEKGKITKLKPIDGKPVNAIKINNNGQILAYTQRDDYTYRTFVITNGKPVEITLEGYRSLRPGAVNDIGDVILETGRSYHEKRATVLCSKGKSIFLQGLRGTHEYPHADSINTNGVIIGACESNKPFPQSIVPFIWEKGRLQLLDDLIPADSGWELGSADAINDKGQIVGCGTRDRKNGYALLLTPVHPLSR